MITVSVRLRSPGNIRSELETNIRRLKRVVVFLSLSLSRAAANQSVKLLLGHSNGGCKEGAAMGS